MFSTKKQSKSVIKITDTHISYITIQKEKSLFSIDKYEIIDIPEGIIKYGEILKADIFSKKIKEIQEKIENKNVDVLLSHDLFLSHHGILGAKDQKQKPKKRIKNYLHNFSQVEPWQKSHICEFETFTFDKKEHVLLTCLQKDIQSSYFHLFKKSGLTIASINSDMLAFGHLFSEGQSSVVCINDKDSCVIDFKDGMFIGHKEFQLSHAHLINDIMKDVSINKEESLRVLEKYGVLRTHKDERVYKRLHRSLASLLDYLKKRKTKPKSKISVIYTTLPIKGLSDELSYSAGENVDDFNIFNIKKYTFKEILSLVKKDSYYYQSHIAQALRFWKK